MAMLRLQGLLFLTLLTFVHGTSDGAVPVLRLPWPAGGTPPEGFATEVVLPLRAGTRAAVAAALEARRRRGAPGSATSS